MTSIFRIVSIVSLLLTASVQAERPNIIVVFIDDMGWGDFSCFGNMEAQTPNIDRLANEGIAFEQFYVNSPICSPSRVAISTGQYPQRWKITSYLDNHKSNARRGMANWLDPRAPMLARSLKDAGYATGHFGKWHMGGQRDVSEAPLITDYGFDESLTNFEGLGPRVLPMKVQPGDEPPKPHNLGSHRLGHGPVIWQDRSLITESFTQSALAMVRVAETKDQPFYVNVWPDDVHTPMHPPLDAWGDGGKRTLYLAVLETMDRQLGELFDYVRSSERLRDNTMILVCSDNGPEVGFGSAGKLRGHKATLFDGGVRSSLVAWAPGLMQKESRGMRNTSSVFSAIDLVPSLLSLAEVPYTAESYDGENMSDVLLGASEGSRSKPIFFRRPPDRSNFRHYKNLPDLAVRSGEWKLYCNYEGGDRELYNLEKDPGESANLEESADVSDKLVEALLAWHQAMPADEGPNLE